MTTNSTRVSRPSRSPEQSEHKNTGTAPVRPSSEWTTYDTSPRSSSRRGSHAYSPEPSRRGSRTDDDPAVTRVVLSSGAGHKEERSRGSWADQPSLMSGEHSSSSRNHKRTVPDDHLANDSQDALLMLFRLSVPVPIYSFGASIYTCCALLFAVLTSPLRLCSVSSYFRTTSFPSQICDLLSPVLHIHERLVHMRPPISDRSSSTQWIRSEADIESSVMDNSDRPYSIGMSIAVLVLSPFFSIAILLLAWTAAFFWIFTMMMGNPDGTERKDDGRAAVIGVCKWWRTWLGKARKLS
ncbi:hypothetical protein N7532_000672 [Penicillium argentinense]|uniref:Uncharacterized protein n=1 Tax=Penicillium argentinense TaxID=1131581 RepID=A0A9W9G749_9EURO|nr:uncharacterized protein N7532_000672 [Penicillium argentinense]KAJ5112627.1 hypothetical protein N7532_000672 [Penicillium argentinense]